MLREIIETEISEQGPMRLDRYMELCLSHPKHGYYMQKQPFGIKGDFTTAPEISQMFGELIGLWLMHMWQALGSPKQFALVELGPGRGTLMADILRTAKILPDFCKAAQIFLIESSEKLKVMQAETIGISITHLESVNAIPDLPLLLVANEFFDALPIRQFIKNDFGWQERVVETGLSPALSTTTKMPELDARYSELETGRTIETNPTSGKVSDVITKLIAKSSGAALIIDYGDFEGVGDTFQAVEDHKKTNPFASPGEADLTAHVRFSDLVQNDIHYNFTTQRSFLLQLGIDTRRAALEAGSGKDVLSDQNRLVGEAEMGIVFKVLALSSMNLENAPGFGK